MKSVSIESKLVSAKHLKDKETINNIYVELSTQRVKLDRWFDKFLDMFDEKLSNCDRNDPIKKLYNSKFNEYSEIARAMKLAESYLKG